MSKHFAIIVIAVAALSTADAASAKSKTCILAGGEATMVTLDLAKFMAEAALKNSIAGKGYEAAGPIKLTCKDPSPLSYCLAERRACK